MSGKFVPLLGRIITIHLSPIFRYVLSPFFNKDKVEVVEMVEIVEPVEELPTDSIEGDL